MVQSTVGDSILGALKSIGGAAARREEEGYTATLAHGEALKNKIAQQAIDDEEDRRTVAEMHAGGYLTRNEDGSFSPDVDKMLSNPELLRRFLGPEANKFLKTNTPNGPMAIQLDSVERVPAKMVPGPNPLDNRQGPISLLGPQPTAPQETVEPERFIVKLRTQDGRTVPATQNASAAADDTLITLDKNQLGGILKGRFARVQAAGGLDNSVSMGMMGMEFQQYVDASMQKMLADDPDAITGGDPVANRDLYSILNNLQGEDLREAVRDRGLDPVKLEQEAAARWADQHKASIEAAEKVAKPTGLSRTEYNDAKALRTRLLKQAQDALTAFDKKGSPRQVDAEMRRRGGPRINPTYEPDLEDPTRKKLVEARDKAAESLAALGAPPATPEFKSNVAPPKFEFTDQNLRDAVAGKLAEQPTAEQTSTMAQYARDNGVTKAADLQKLPPNDAKMLAWVIASNVRDPARRQETLEKLLNYARTEDFNKSPIDANVDIAAARAAVSQANTAAGNLEQRAVEHADNMAVNAAELSLKARELGMKMAENDSKLKDEIGKAHGEVSKLASTIRLGITNDDLTIKPPTKEAMDAWHQIQSGTKNLPLGSPKQIAMSYEYLDAMFNMSAAQTLIPGQAAWWDFSKHIANLFFREKGQLNMSPMIETARIEWKNGNPERVSFTKHAGTPDEVEMVVGANEFKRFTGASSFTDFVNAVIAQKAATMLEKQGVSPTPELMAEAIAQIKAEAGAQ